MGRAELVGCWSADAIYGPGAQSDEILVFKEDGAGFLEVSNPTPCFAELFHWDIDTDGGLQLRGDRVLQLNEDSTAVETLNSDLNVAVCFTIQVEATKAGCKMRVLRFFTRPWRGITDHFGFCQRDVAHWEPDFSWLK